MGWLWLALFFMSTGSLVSTTIGGVQLCQANRPMNAYNKFITE